MQLQFGVLWVAVAVIIMLQLGDLLRVEPLKTMKKFSMVSVLRGLGLTKEKKPKLPVRERFKNRNSNKRSRNSLSKQFKAREIQQMCLQSMTRLKTPLKGRYLQKRRLKN